MNVAEKIRDLQANPACPTQLAHVRRNGLASLAHSKGRGIRVKVKQPASYFITVVSGHDFRPSVEHGCGLRKPSRSFRQSGKSL